MSRSLRHRRWKHFRRGAAYSPGSVYHHRTRGWAYIPVHAFGDEPDVLARLGMSPADCRWADAWWGTAGDATLMRARVGQPVALYAQATESGMGWVYLVAALDAPYVTRAAFEDVMARFADAGFPHDPRFRLPAGKGRLYIAGAPPDANAEAGR